MQGAPISSWIAAKENKPRLGNQAGFYFVCYLPFANHPNSLQPIYFGQCHAIIFSTSLSKLTAQHALCL
ncbi:hypothetical protein OFO93_41335, partial [Escherichia coli]|nr:hypothetical protein [Escherichia coli]